MPRTQIDINNSFSAADTERDELFTLLRDISNDRDNVLNTKLDSSIVTQQYLTDNCPEAAAFFAAGGTVDNFIRNEMTKREKINAIKYYFVEEYLAGEHDFYDDLDKAEKEKEKRKARYKERAEALVASYESILDGVDSDIKTIEDNIKKIEAKIAKAEQQIIDIEAQKDEEVSKGGAVARNDKAAAIARLEARIITWRDTDIPRQQGDLSTSRGLQQQFLKQKNDRITEVKTRFGAKGIFLGVDGKGEVKEEAANKQPDVGEAAVQGSQTTNPSVSNGRPGFVELAKSAGAKAENYYRLTDPELEAMIAKGDFASFRGTLQHLAPFASARLKRKLDTRLENAFEDYTNRSGSTDITYQGVSLTLENLKGIRKLDSNTLKSIQDIINNAEKNYARMTPAEAEEYSNWFSVISTSLLLNDVGIARVATRTKDFFTKQGSQIDGLNASAEQYSDKKLRVEKARKDIDNKLSTRLKVEQDSNPAVQKATRAERRNPQQVSRHVSESEMGDR